MRPGADPYRLCQPFLQIIGHSICQGYNGHGWIDEGSGRENGRTGDVEVVAAEQA